MTLSHLAKSGSKTGLLLTHTFVLSFLFLLFCLIIYFSWDQPECISNDELCIKETFCAMRDSDDDDDRECTVPTIVLGQTRAEGVLVQVLGFTQSIICVLKEDYLHKSYL